MTIREARPILEEIELEKRLNAHNIVQEAIQAVEEDGVVFIDEIDKICSTERGRGPTASDEGVQKDLLPLIEGCAIPTKHGFVHTDHILFIASGAFHSCKPSDLLAELQGRLPIRVELTALTRKDLLRILTEPRHNLIAQQIALMRTEHLQVEFTPEALEQIAGVAYEMNEEVENIGARRLHTILERVMEELSFNAPEMAIQQAQAAQVVTEAVVSETDSNSGTENRNDSAASASELLKVVVDEQYVQKRVGSLLEKSDLRKFIL
eukprot:c20767_g3_i7.p1 GENE.c20767_g3_i7~~c20767_g3_i7.p1  ORF type:complete len:265 (-),score=81.40 c20767_g3_i7:45-839(-)